MAEPTKINKLKSTLMNLSGIEKRKSPLGWDEFIIPEESANSIYGDPYAAGETNLDERGIPFISYNKARAEDEEVLNHERIHASQMLLNNPSPQRLVDVLNINPPEAINNYGEKFANIEHPAYEFMNVDPPEIRQRQNIKFKKYMDEIFRLNPRNSDLLEAVMPNELMRNYIKNNPSTYIPPPKIIK